MNTQNRRRHEEGVALLVAMIFLVVAAIALGAMSIRLSNQSRQTDHYITFKKCFEGIECGFAEARAELDSGGDGLVGVDENWSFADQGLPAFDMDGVAPVLVATMPNVEYFAFANNWAADNVDNNGDGVVDGPEESGLFTIYAFARNQEVRRGAEIVVEGADVNVWNNAIFAGSGGAGGAISGNVSIHGSVHILGNHVPAGGDSVVVVDMTGTSLIHNNYEPQPADAGIVAELTQRMPLIPVETFNGEMVESLEAKLRVKRGLVSINGNVEIGQADAFGNAFKETVNAIYNTDGWTGNKAPGGIPDPTAVFSDNGWEEGYDLGDKVPFPSLTDDWRWPEHVNCWEYDGVPIPIGSPGAVEPSPDGDNYMHGEFFGDILSDSTAYNGDVIIDTDDDFYLNLTTGDTDPANAGARVQSNPATCTLGDDYIYYDSSNNVMEINGQIEINGAFELNQKGNNDTIYYTGRAAILAHGDCVLDTNLLPCDGGNPAAFNHETFPKNNVFGIMSAGSMEVGNSSQLALMGAFYADQQITCSKQTFVAGTFVSNYFNMGNQVPDIYQVPDLAKYLPFGMIGNWPIWAWSPLSWRELQT